MDDTQDYMQDALALAEMRRLIQDTPASELRPYPTVHTGQDTEHTADQQQ